MVLSWRSGVLGVLGVLGLAGCSESLFGTQRAANPADAAGAGDAAGRCSGTCISDAAQAFDGTETGVGNRWRYLEDLRTRSWIAMGDGEPAGAVRVGGDPRNLITTCRDRPGAAACGMLPGALLVSAAGTGGLADPAIAFVAPISQGIQLALRVAVPEGDDPTIRLYRNSREDVLFTGTARAGATLEHTVTLDALAGDRFLLAVVPTTDQGAREVGVDLTVHEMGAFPSSCQYAFTFEFIDNVNALLGACDHEVLLLNDAGATPIQQAPGPFVEQGKSLRLSAGTHLVFATTSTIDYASEATVQFWVSQRTAGAAPAWLFSDADLASGGGMGVAILAGLPAMLDVKVGTSPAPTFVRRSVAYDNPFTWHFLRLVRTRTNLQVCVDGAHVMTIDAAAPGGARSRNPNFGKDVQDTAAMAAFEGSLDDVRVITGALPCAPPP